MGWRGKEGTVSDMYRTWGGKAKSEMRLICTEHGVERQISAHLQTHCITFIVKIIIISTKKLFLLYGNILICFEMKFWL